MGQALFRALVASALLTAQGPPPWPDTFNSRVQVLALMQTLNAEILASRSATATLERWCRDHRLADTPTIVAVRVAGADKILAQEQRLRLRVAEREPVRYRRVRLRCGDHVLSEADNWYVPARLTAEMNRLLDTTDTPFGRVVQPLEPYRQTFATRVLWSPLPVGWEMPSGGRPPATDRPLAIPDELFEHRAILYTRDHVPFSEVAETYLRPVLAFPPPR
jgi:chorismate-pyruvate lyase